MCASWLIGCGEAQIRMGLCSIKGAAWLKLGCGANQKGGGVVQLKAKGAVWLKLGCGVGQLRVHRGSYKGAAWLKLGCGVV